MARLVFRINQSLDGFVDHDRMEPGPAVFRHWIDAVAGVAGGIYGRRTYDLMRYWDGDDPSWSADYRAFAAAWQTQRKWVVSRSLATVGPGATLVSGDVEATIRRLKGELDGEISLSGPMLAGSLAGLGLIDAYELYVHPVLLGSGSPVLAGATPSLRFLASEAIGDGVVRLTYGAA